MSKVSVPHTIYDFYNNRRIDLDHHNDRPRYHIDNYDDLESGVYDDCPVINLYEPPCYDDNCGRDHYYVYGTDEHAALFVERPRYHTHDDGFRGNHNHDGRAIGHVHFNDGAIYFYRINFGPRTDDSGNRPK